MRSSSHNPTDEDEDDLVPHLDAAFDLSGTCQVNLDPIVVAVACFLRTQRQPHSAADKGVTAAELVEKGGDWFPQRRVHSVKQEAERLARFAQTYPDVFRLNHDTITLKPQALFVGRANPCDEAWYTIALLRLMHHDSFEVNQVFDDLEAVQRAYLLQHTAIETSEHKSQATATDVQELLDSLKATTLCTNE